MMDRPHSNRKQSIPTVPPTPKLSLVAGITALSSSAVYLGRAEGVLAGISVRISQSFSLSLASTSLICIVQEKEMCDVRNIQEPILILVLLIDTAHQCSRWWQNFINEDEDGLLWRKLDALADDVDELPDCEVRWDQVLLLVDGRDVRFLDFLADHL